MAVDERKIGLRSENEHSRQARMSMEQLEQRLQRQLFTRSGRVPSGPNNYQ